MTVKTVEIVEKRQLHPTPSRPAPARFRRLYGGAAGRLDTLISQLDTALRQDGWERAVRA